MKSVKLFALGGSGIHAVDAAVSRQPIGLGGELSDHIQQLFKVCGRTILRHQKTARTPFFGVGTLAAVLVFGVVFAGCASAPTAAPKTALSPELTAIIGKYVVPETQNWGDVGDVQVYSVDPAQFKALLAEVDAAGEFVKQEAWTETRDWEKGVEFARVGILSDGRVQFDLCKKNNSINGYRYKPKAEGAEVVKLYDSISKYAAPRTENWGNEGEVLIYRVDAARFDDLKAEVDALGGYYLSRSGMRAERDWDKGQTFARVAVFTDGRAKMELGKADNSTTDYTYKAGVLETVEAKAPSAPMPIGPKLAASLKKYAGYETQNWGNEGEVAVYNVDPLRFADLKAEIDAGGEYALLEGGTSIRDWRRGENFANVGAMKDGRIQIRLGKSDNYTTEYQYKKSAGGTAVGAKLAATIGKFTAPIEVFNESGELFNRYFVDPLRFKEFKAEVEAGGEYIPDGETKFDTDVLGTVVGIIIRPSGRIGLDLMKEKSTTRYWYSPRNP